MYGRFPKRRLTEPKTLNNMLNGGNSSLNMKIKEINTNLGKMLFHSLAIGMILLIDYGTSVGQAPGYSGPGATNPELMLVGEWVPDNPHNIDFDNLPLVPSQHAIVNDVRGAGGTRVNQHNYLVHYDGRFWAMWSDGPGMPTVSPEKHQNVNPRH